MLIIIEGADGSGKTTLYNELKKLGYETIHPDNYDEYVDWLDALIYCDKINKICISDRSFLTDIPYRLWDNKKRTGMRLINMCYLLRDMKIIYCKSGTEYQDSIKRGEDLIVRKKDSDAIINSYDVLLKILEKFQDVQVLTYNWHTDNIDKVIEFIGEPNGTI